MGIKNFGQFVEKYCPSAKGEVSIDVLQGTKIAIDGSNAFYAFYYVAFKTLVQKLQDVLRDEVDQDQLCRKWVESVVVFLCKFLRCGCVPIVIFDGLEKPVDKIATEKRKEIRKKAIQKYEDVKEELLSMSSEQDLPSEYKNISILSSKGSRGECMTMKMQTLQLNPSHTETLYNCLYHLGFPVVRSVGDGERLCAALCRDGYANSVFSTDTDAVVLGSPFVFKPSRSPNSLSVYDLEEILSRTGYTKAQLIDLAILLGCDYNDGISGIGVVSGHKLMQRYKKLEEIPHPGICSLNVDICRKFFQVSEHSCQLVSSHELTKDTLPMVLLMSSISEESEEFLSQLGLMDCVRIVRSWN